LFGVSEIDMRIISGSRSGQPEFRSSNKAMSNKVHLGKTLVHQSAAWPIFMGSTFENKDHPNKQHIQYHTHMLSQVNDIACVWVNMYTEKYSALTVRQVQLVRMSTTRTGIKVLSAATGATSNGLLEGYHSVHTVSNLQQR
jgi:hypothetical protein